MKAFHHPALAPVIGVAAFAVVAVAVFTIAGCASSAKDTPVTFPTPVRVASVAEGTTTLPIRTSGRLGPKKEMRLSFKTRGLVEHIYVDEGSRVRKGQLLARLDLSEIDAQVRQAQSGFEKAKRDAERMHALYRDSVATLEHFQNAETALNVAESSLEIASFNREHSEIRAPESGRVLRKLVEVNELVNPGEPVVVIGATSDWVVRIGLADRDVVQLQLGDIAHFRFDAFPDRTFEGRVTEIAEAADPFTGTFEVEVSVDDPESRLKAGFIAHVDLYSTLGESYDLIPIDALVDADGSRGVVFSFDADSSVVRKREILVAEILGDSLAVRSGLDAVEAVVTAGAPYLRDGDVVALVQ